MTEQVPLLFFRPLPHADPVAVAHELLGHLPTANGVSFDPGPVIQVLRNSRGLRRLKVALPVFRLSNSAAEAALEGTVAPTHIRVAFFGNFEKLAEPLVRVFIATGLTCFSVWDESVLTAWPKWKVPAVDRGFAERMKRILERRSIDLRQIEPDERRRSRALNAFVKGSEFRAEMAQEARREPGRGAKSYDDFVNCYVRWKGGRASAAELGAVRKLDRKWAEMPLCELRALAGNLPRLLLATAVAPSRAVQWRRAAEGLGVDLEVEPI